MKLFNPCGPFLRGEFRGNPYGAQYPLCPAKANAFLYFIMKLSQHRVEFRQAADPIDSNYHVCVKVAMLSRM
ncbi:predicted protein [Plenodomus lingam JN3]|uniref:Predicted protein n=1 Tax=Leptosphaeria maculans (strain JN3 / isolate v23.1.3 / race Av1-4-5-6-7-8) TaxID=985895 RepID=E5A877_LEPMJ|nr:predicted protein [Plenodomus lingam JN3]CBX99822.1 predicted protein [Plenodomus lingam JN3]